MAAGYEGFGVTVGGDKSSVVKVTSLADDGPGSLREALRQGGRRIVFAKSGTVKLKNPKAPDRPTQALFTAVKAPTSSCPI